MMNDYTIHVFTRLTEHECGYQHKLAEVTNTIPIEGHKSIRDIVCNGCNGVGGRWFLPTKTVDGFHFTNE